jgi:quaternary ammonium compound-resistance protein SugE
LAIGNEDLICGGFSNGRGEVWTFPVNDQAPRKAQEPAGTPYLYRKLIHKRMNWLLIIIAGICEVGFTICLSKARETSGWVAAGWIAAFFISLSVSMWLLYKATQEIPMGTAYAVWTGIGAAGTVIAGIFLFNEAVDFWRIFFLSTLILSVIGLKMVTH